MHTDELTGWMRSVERRLERLNVRAGNGRSGVTRDFLWLAESGTPNIPDNANPHIVVRWNEQQKSGSSLERFTYGVRVLRSGLYVFEGQSGYTVAQSGHSFRTITSLGEMSTSGSIVSELTQTRGERALQQSTPAITFPITMTMWCDSGFQMGMTLYQQGESSVAPYTNSKQFYLRATRIG